MFIAYFGDSVQNIYDAGVGERLTRLHPELDFVLKEYNRRSYIEVIDVANRVRNDEVVQNQFILIVVEGMLNFIMVQEKM